MASHNRNVLVFGPTGAVGCAAAVEAHRRGVSVWLAMRDTNKPIPGLNKNSTNSDDTSSLPGYTRIQADLSQPDSLKHAVQKSGASAAFVYTIFDSPNSMLDSFAALKDAGITYVVLLSSYTVRGSAHGESNTEEFIQRVHAKTEIALEESGIPYAAVRPCYFNSNIFWNFASIREDIKKGEIDVFCPDIKFDYLDPADVGTVCGALLAEPRFRDETDEQGRATSKFVYLCGPELMTQRAALGIIARSVGREIKVREIDQTTWFEKLSYMPRSVLEAVANGMRKSNDGYEAYPKEIYDESVANLRKYKEREPTRFEEWVEANKKAFE